MVKFIGACVLGVIFWFCAEMLFGGYLPHNGLAHFGLYAVIVALLMKVSS